jgi:Fe-S-cluster-containing hydrogenase component 2
MVERSKRIKAGESNLIPKLPGWSKYNISDYLKGGSPVAEKQIARGIPASKAGTHAFLKYDEDKCIFPECRLCMENCPIDGIDLTLDPPIIGKPCMSCRFCTQICPTGALIDVAAILIEDYPEDLKKGQTYMKNLEKAEQEGRFRRLIPAEEIDWENRIYIKHNKHPQWIIGKGLQ